MLLLRSNRVFKNLLELDPVTGGNREFSQANMASASEKVSGFFDHLGGVLVAIYAFSGHLILKIGERAISITPEVTVVTTGAPNSRKLEAFDNKIVLATVTYAVTNISKFENDPTSFIENEDFDFGLFVANLIGSTDRKAVALENWQ